MLIKEGRIRMDTRRLHYFIRIVDTGTISRAADSLNIAQPALSQHVAALEAELGTQLLNRSRQGVTPTRAGLSLYRSSQAILRLERAVKENIKGSPSGPSGFASIGLGTFSCANTIGINVLRKTQERFPDIVIHFVENLSVIFSQAIKMGLLDAAIIYDPGPIRGVQFEQIATEELYLVASPNSRVVENGATEITLEEVGALELFLPRPHHILRQILERGFREAGLELVIRAEIEPSLALLKAVREGLGVACLPKSVVEEIFPAGEFQVLRIVSPVLHATFSLCTAKGEPMSEAAGAVVRLIREEIAEASRPAA
jgi:LysR family nitrogen assimilation transcriptional regulator